MCSSGSTRSRSAHAQSAARSVVAVLHLAATSPRERADGHRPLPTAAAPGGDAPSRNDPCPSTAGNILMAPTSKVHLATVVVSAAATRLEQNTVGLEVRLTAGAIVVGLQSEDPRLLQTLRGDLRDSSYIPMRLARPYPNPAAISPPLFQNDIMPPDPGPEPPGDRLELLVPVHVSRLRRGRRHGHDAMLESIGSTTLNNSVPAVFVLVPTSSYSCKTPARRAERQRLRGRSRSTGRSSSTGARRSRSAALVPRSSQGRGAPVSRRLVPDRELSCAELTATQRQDLRTPGWDPR